MESIVSLITFFIGLLIGSFVFWLIGKTKITRTGSQIRTEYEPKVATLEERVLARD